MESFSRLPWTQIHEFLLDLGNVREPKTFCVQVIRKIYPLIPYDQARVYFVNDSEKIYDAVLVGVDPWWSDSYLQYYSRIENGRYSIPGRSYLWPGRLENGRYVLPKVEGGVYDWAKYECDEFVTNYIKPQGLRYSAGFAFHSADNFTKGVYCLDRTSRRGFTPIEIEIMSVVQPHLDNLHRNMFVLASAQAVKNQAALQPLTPREAEVAALLCQGATPARISRRLVISLPTVYRHIANIHVKLDVSSCQELLLRLLN